MHSLYPAHSSLHFVPDNTFYEHTTLPVNDKSKHLLFSTFRENKGSVIVRIHFASFDLSSVFCIMYMVIGFTCSMVPCVETGCLIHCALAINMVHILWKSLFENIAITQGSSPFLVQAFYGQNMVNLPQIATEANSTDMIS